MTFQARSKRINFTERAIPCEGRSPTIRCLIGGRARRLVRGRACCTICAHSAWRNPSAGRFAPDPLPVVAPASTWGITLIENELQNRAPESEDMASLVELLNTLRSGEHACECGRSFETINGLRIHRRSVGHLVSTVPVQPQDVGYQVGTSTWYQNGYLVPDFPTAAAELSGGS